MQLYYIQISVFKDLQSKYFKLFRKHFVLQQQQQRAFVFRYKKNLNFVLVSTPHTHT